MSNLNTTHAYVTLKIKLNVPSHWGNDCTMDQVMKQAKDDANGMLRNAFKDKPYQCEILGDLEVTAISKVLK